MSLQALDQFLDTDAVSGRVPVTAEKLLGDAILRRFRGRIALVSSFGAEAAALLHLVATVDPATPVIFLDTGKLFGETLAYRDHLVRRLGLGDVRSTGPDPEQLRQRDPDGTLWMRDPDACCALRKAEPLARALAPFDAWINGRKRHHGGDRAALRMVELVDGRTKLNPLADWDAQDIDAYLTRHDLPRHPLVAQGYGSIGCEPCTTPVGAGESARDGRWRGKAKTECGIHLPSVPAAIAG